MATLHLAVLNSRQDKEGKFPVFVAVTVRRQVRYIKTDYYIDNLYEFDNGKIVCRKDAAVMNQRLRYVLADFQEKLNGIHCPEQYHVSCLKDMLECKRKAEEAVTIKEYMERRIRELEKEGRKSYADMNAYSLKLIVAILGDIPLQEFRPETVARFDAGMKKRGLSPATRQMRLIHLKARLNEAVEEGMVRFEAFPFSKFKIPRPGVRLQDVTVEEFVRIRELRTVHKRLSLARDLFLLSFYLGGMNLADIVEVDFSGGEVNYSRRKTRNKTEGEKAVVFSIQPEAKAIIRKYVKRNGRMDFGYRFSYKNFQCYLNSCFKKLAEEVGIRTTFSFYSARKTFSQFAYDLGIRTETIEYCIGQTMKENRPIYNYVRIMKKQADAAIRKVIDYTENPDAFPMD